MTKITTFLMFNNNGKKAVDFYISLFKNSEVHHILANPDNNMLMSATFSLDGHEFLAMDGGEHFKFAEGISLFVSCKDQAEVDYYWSKFIEDGGKASQCGWLTDAYGISWQIIPEILGQLLSDPDHEKSGRAMQTMLKMNKIIVEDLQKAAA